MGKNFSRDKHDNSSPSGVCQSVSRTSQQKHQRYATLRRGSTTSNKQLKLLRVRTTTNGRVPSQIPKSVTKNIAKSSQKLFKSKPRDHLRAGKHSVAVQEHQKLNFRVRVPQDACQEGSKFDLQETPEAPKIKTFYHVPKNINVGHCLEAPNEAFGNQKEGSGTHLGGSGPLRAHLRFFKDIPYGLHGFVIDDPCYAL